MNMSVVELIKLGRKYMLLWPQRVELSQYFDEYRAVQVGRGACRYLPTVALIVFILQLYLGGMSYLPYALVYLFFILTIPVQALVMLGVKADKFLPPSLANWYKQGVAKVNEQGGSVKLSVKRPRYLDLAKLLNVSYQSLHFKQ
ncbi:terminus macrodomain insulation protein YfbV [Thalassotalea fusca]